MGIKSERIIGSKIINEIDSSMLVRTEYDTITNNLIVIFPGEVCYEYNNVPWSIYTKFRMSESQGSFFNKEIAKKYNYKKVIKEES
jgi:hypothetical protein